MRTIIFFVSKRLQQTSDKIAKTNNKSHLYTGPSDIFYKRSISDKQKLREELNIQSKYLIGHIGNLVHVKNILCLPCWRDAINGVCYCDPRGIEHCINAPYRC